ncbi:glycosyltransferase family A protein [Sphingobacterium faecium]|uniref:glycosyltransferase family A protein n=1 Tax=Sphingobacterium faecium TaxID=34087 RepID=UPI003208C856
MLPLISCLCLTRNRPIFLEKSIRCFLLQTYANKELVILYLEDDIATKKVLNTIKDNRIVSFAIDPKLNLTTGELRNLSIQYCNGDYFCQWDDDDWNHCERLQIQMDGILKSKKSASILTKWFIYDLKKKQVFLSCNGPWAGSLLCSKKLINRNIKYPNRDKKEDSIFLGKLLKLNCLYPIQVPQLYIYVFHGNNTWDEEHFRKMFARSKKMTKEINDMVDAIISDKIPGEEGALLLNSSQVLKEIDYFN